MLVNTPYDDVFRTLSNDCPSLLIPVVNEMFHEHFTGNERIVFHPNEHFINRQDGTEKERITDTCFEIIGEYVKKYHLECQSTADSSMLVRMFEYDTQIALDEALLNKSVLTVHFPNSAILYLRSSASTPDLMRVRMLTPGGEVTYPITVMKTQEYTIDMIFEKNLLFFIPFYIFSHESRFMEYNKNNKSLEPLLREYEDIKNRLEKLCIQKTISEFYKHTLIDMSNKVLEHIAKKYARVKEGVKSVMGGKILEHEAKTILRQGKIETFIEMVRDGFIPVTEAAKRLNISVEEFQSYMKP